MPKLVTNILQRFEFTEEELNIGGVFSGLQKDYIMNEAAIMAEKRATFGYNPDSANIEKEFRGEMEFMRGYITALTFIVRMSEEREDMLKTQIQQTIQNQQTDTINEKEV